MEAERIFRNPSTSHDMPEEIKINAIQKKKIEIQIGCVIKDEDDKLIDTKLPIGYVYDYSIKEWYLEP